jgi:hypothetical protein
MNDTSEIERCVIFSAGAVLGIVLSYTSLLGFLVGVGTGVFVGNKYDKLTQIVIMTAKRMVADKSKKDNK